MTVGESVGRLEIIPRGPTPAAARSVVVAVSTADRESLRCAVHLFDRSVDEGEPFEERERFTQWLAT